MNKVCLFYGSEVPTDNPRKAVASAFSFQLQPGPARSTLYKYSQPRPGVVDGAKHDSFLLVVEHSNEGPEPSFLFLNRFPLPSLDSDVGARVKIVTVKEKKEGKKATSKKVFRLWSENSCFVVSAMTANQMHVIRIDENKVGAKNARSSEGFWKGR